MTRARLAALHLALAAMLLRALLPVGWMPSLGAANGPITLCTLDGPAQHNPGKPAPDDGQHSHDECPFAGAPHFATPTVAALLTAPALAVQVIRTRVLVAHPAQLSTYQPQAPRAPPHRV